MHRKHERSPKIPRLAIILLATGGLSLFFSHGGVKDAASDDIEKKIEEKNLVLDSIRTELIKGREKLRKLMQEEGSYISQLEQLDRNIMTSQNYVKRLDCRMDTASRTIAALTTALAAENSKLALRQEEMRKRLRSIYKIGQLEIPQIVLTSRSMSELLHRMRYFEVLHLYDKRLILQIDSARMHIKDRKTSLEQYHRELSLFRKEKEREYGELVKEQESRRTLLAEVRSQKAAYAAMIKDLEAASQELKKIVAMLESRRNKARTSKEQRMLSAFERRKGALPWPVKGKVLLEFGKVVHSVYKTVIMNTGIDISARKGDKVRCIASGKVAYVGWMRGLGKFVIVDHGGYYSTYAHMDEINVRKDDEVANGSIVGVIGEQGVVGGTKLHFEIRKSTEALDPRDWLERRE